MLVMTDGSASPEIFIPAFGDMPTGVRFLLTVLERWADARGSIDASEEELSAFTGMSASTVRRHLAWAAAEARGWVSRSERRRLPNGQLSGYRYWLRLEKFGRLDGHRSNRAVAEEGGAPVGKPVDEPPPKLSGGEEKPPLNLSNPQPGPPPKMSGGPPELSGGEPLKDNGILDPSRERARAFPFPFPSSFLSFPWRDEAMMTAAETILSACGPKLAPLDQQDARVLKSLAWVLEPAGVWAGFDMAADIVPVVKLKTGPGRSNLLWDFALLTDNLERHRARRLAPPKARAGKAGFTTPERSAAETRAARIAALRNLVRDLGTGGRPEFALPREARLLSGAAKEEAYRRLLRDSEDELARLVAEARAKEEA